MSATETQLLTQLVQAKTRLAQVDALSSYVICTMSDAKEAMAKMPPEQVIELLPRWIDSMVNKTKIIQEVAQGQETSKVDAEAIFKQATDKFKRNEN